MDTLREADGFQAAKPWYFGSMHFTQSGPSAAPVAFQILKVSQFEICEPQEGDNMSMTYTWNIWSVGDFYRIQRNDGVEVTPAPHGQLGQALGCHLIHGEQYNDVLRQLAATGKAQITVTTLKGGLRQG
jgi:hypothetical protein